ncbi:MAG TPA: HAMP domain-containing sensor histidine kinase [Azospirillum sp.]
MERLLGTANHDLRQPFQAMQLFHHLLMGRMPDAPSRELCAKMGEASQACEAMIRALLDVLSLEAGLVAAAPRAFPVDDVLERLLREFDPAADAKGLRLTVRPAGVAVRSDPELLEKLLRPLLANAVRFTQKGGILLGARRRGAWLRIEVWDTGTGLAEPDLRAIEEELATGRSDRRRGFGIAIARRIAALLDHPMAVRSRAGKGTGFFVQVPVAG